MNSNLAVQAGVSIVNISGTSSGYFAEVIHTESSGTKYEYIPVVLDSGTDYIIDLTRIDAYMAGSATRETSTTVEGSFLADPRIQAGSPPLYALDSATAGALGITNTTAGYYLIEMAEGATSVTVYAATATVGADATAGTADDWWTLATTGQEVLDSSPNFPGLVTLALGYGAPTPVDYGERYVIYQPNADAVATASGGFLDPSKYYLYEQHEQWDAIEVTADGVVVDGQWIQLAGDPTSVSTSGATTIADLNNMNMGGGMGPEVTAVSGSLVTISGLTADIGQDLYLQVEANGGPYTLTIENITPADLTDGKLPVDLENATNASPANFTLGSLTGDVILHVLVDNDNDGNKDAGDTYFSKTLTYNGGNYDGMSNGGGTMPVAWGTTETTTPTTPTTPPTTPAAPTLTVTQDGADGVITLNGLSGVLASDDFVVKVSNGTDTYKAVIADVSANSTSLSVAFSDLDKETGAAGIDTFDVANAAVNDKWLVEAWIDWEGGNATGQPDGQELYVSREITVNAVDSDNDMAGATVNLAPAPSLVLDSFVKQADGSWELQISGAGDTERVFAFLEDGGYSHANSDSTGSASVTVWGEPESGPYTVTLWADTDMDWTADRFEKLESFSITVAADGATTISPTTDWMPPELLPQEISVSSGDVAPGSWAQVNILGGLISATLTAKLQQEDGTVVETLMPYGKTWNSYVVWVPADAQGLKLALSTDTGAVRTTTVDSVPAVTSDLDSPTDVLTTTSFDIDSDGDGVFNTISLTSPLVDPSRSHTGEVTLGNLYIPDSEAGVDYTTVTSAQFRIGGVLNETGELTHRFVDAIHLAAPTIGRDTGLAPGWVLDAPVNLSVPVGVTHDSSSITYQLYLDGVPQGNQAIQEVVFDHINPQTWGGADQNGVVEALDRADGFWGPGEYADAPPTVYGVSIENEFILNFSEAVYFTNVLTREEDYYALTGGEFGGLISSAGDYVIAEVGNGWKIWDVDEGSEHLEAYVLDTNTAAVAAIESYLGTATAGGTVDAYLYGSTLFGPNVDVDVMWVQQAEYYNQEYDYWSGHWAQINRFDAPQDIGRISGVYVASDSQGELYIDRPINLREVTEGVWAQGADATERTITYDISGYAGPRVVTLEGATQRVSVSTDSATLNGVISGATLEWSDVHQNQLTSAFDATLTLTVSASADWTAPQISALELLINEDAIVKNIVAFTSGGIRDSAGNLLDGMQIDRDVLIDPSSPQDVVYRAETGLQGRDTLDLTALGGGLAVQPEYGWVDAGGGDRWYFEPFNRYVLEGGDNKYWGIEDFGATIILSGHGDGNEIVGGYQTIDNISYFYADAGTSNEGIAVNLSVVNADGWVEVTRYDGGVDYLQGIDSVSASVGDDTLTGTLDFEFLAGDDGDDTIYGGPGTGTATSGDLLVGGGGTGDEVVGTTGFADIVVDLDGGLLSGRDDSEAWVQGEKSAASDHDVFVVAADATIKNFALSNDQVHLSGRSGEAADRIVFALNAATVVAAAMASAGITGQDPHAADFVLTEEIETATKTFIRSMTVEQEVVGDDLVLTLMTADATPVPMGNVTLAGVAAALSGDQAEVVRLDKYESSAFDLMAYAMDEVGGSGSHPADGGVAQSVLASVTRDAEIFIPIAIEAVAAGTIGGAVAGGVMAPPDGILDNVARQFVPGFGDQDLLGGLNNDSYRFVVQNFSEESGGVVGDAGHDTVFDVGGNDDVYLADAKISDISVYAVHVGRERSANSLEITYTQTTQDGVDANGDPIYLVNQGSIEWLGHYRQGGAYALETITVSNDAGNGLDVYAVAQAEYGAGGRNLVVDASDPLAMGIVAGAQGETDHIEIAGTQSGATELRVWGFDTATDTIDITAWLTDNGVTSAPKVAWDNSNDAMTIFDTSTGSDVELTTIYFMDWSDSETLDQVTLITS
jgi:stringent starvation protein B